LTEKGKTYEIDGIIYLRNRAFNVGMLSRKPYVDLTHNRIEPDPNKEDPRDFILWKPIPNDYEFGFEYPESSPLHSTEAKGQPGWHIECSAMAEEVLGSKIDIHGGGEDLMFPHHENEISQCYARHGHFMSKFWLHNGFVTNSKGQKFGKSLDNAITVNEALNKFGGEVIRFYMLMTHYRSPKTWSLEGLVEAQTIFMKFQNLTHGVFHPYNKPPTEFWDALMNDMNTPLAIAKMHEYAKKDIFSLDICMRWLGF
jgi:cysteinyl-tRNA synthetase